MLSIALMFLKSYWKQAIVVLLSILLLAFLRSHYVSLGEQRAQARYAQMEDKAAQELAELKKKAAEADKKSQAEIGVLTASRNAALAEARKAPVVLTKIVTKVMHEGETCTSNDISPDFERVWNDAAKAGSDKPVP